MKPMPELDALLKRAVAKGIFGTKMRSVINAANPKGIAAVVAQQFEVGKQILAHGLIPIIEPEVTISIADKARPKKSCWPRSRSSSTPVPATAGHAEADAADQSQPLQAAGRRIRASCASSPCRAAIRATMRTAKLEAE
jgi:uncharacterized protein (DUF2236 family)